jgi:hypothetical protein
MKGTVPRPQWPAPAVKSATQVKTSRGSGRESALGPAGQSTVDLGTQEEPPIDATNRITLAVLEEYSAAKSKGYDPYNASAARHRPADVWKRKPKRD